MSAAATARQLVVKFVGAVDPSLGKAAATVNGKLKGAGTAADNTKAKTAALAATALVVAGAAVKMGKDSVAAFKSAAGEVIPLKRNLGLTAEDASRLRFQMKMSGLDVTASGKSWTFFSKVLAGAVAGSKAQQKAMDSLGVSYKDAQGKALPMAQLIPLISDRFASMKDGPEKTALAMKLFGKQGAALLPFLNKGSAGLADLAAQSDKYGETLTGENLAALVASKKAQREWSAAVEGFQVQFGAKLLPLLTLGATTITGVLIPAMNGGAAFFRDNQAAIGLTASVVGVLVVGYGALAIAQNAQAAGGFLKYLVTVGQATKVWSIAQGFLNVVMSANPIALVVIAIAALVAGIIYAYNNCKEFRQVVDVSFKAIADSAVWLWNNALQPALKWIVAGFGWVMDGVANFLDALGTVPGFEWEKGAATSIRGVAKAAKDAANNINQIPIRKRVVVSAADEASAKLATVQSKLAGLKDKLVKAKAEGDTSEVDRLQRKIDALKDKRVKLQAEIEKGTIVGKVKIIADPGQKGNGSARFRMIAMAGGGILGGERHAAQIAQAGAMRLWAEPETGGEGYVPLGASKRGQSIPVWWEIGRRLGVVQFAQGGVYGGQGQVASGASIAELLMAIRALGALITAANERLVAETLRAASSGPQPVTRLGH
jgi:hypothetical protein